MAIVLYRPVKNTLVMILQYLISLLNLYLQPTENLSVNSSFRKRNNLNLINYHKYSFDNEEHGYSTDSVW